MHRNGSDSTNIIRKQDIYLILLFLGIGLAAFFWLHFHKQTGEMVQVTVDGTLQGTYSLQKEDKIEIEGEDWKNTLIIEDGYVDMTEADCPDQICVKHAKISQVGETIVCLPHKVVVEIVGEKQEENQYDVIAN